MDLRGETSRKTTVGVKRVEGGGDERNPGVTPRHGSRVAPHHFQDVALRAI